MEGKLLFISLAILTTFCNAIEIHHAPVIKYTAPALIKAPIALKEVEYEYGPAEYEYSYSVHDPHTGDIKSQKETRKGDSVEGSYEVIDPDGFRRLVKYTADKHNGFNAIVHREPTDIKIPQPEPKQHKIVYAAPKLIAHAPKYVAAPIVHYAPIAKVIAPVTKVIAPAPKYISEGGNHVTFSAPAVSYHY